jgi:hypothetical protein
MSNISLYRDMLLSLATLAGAARKRLTGDV